MIELETVEAVHTIQFNEINKKATKLAFNCNRKKTDYIKNIVCLFVRFKGKGGKNNERESTSEGEKYVKTK